MDKSYSNYRCYSYEELLIQTFQVQTHHNDHRQMKFQIISYSLIFANLFHFIQCLQCYESVGKTVSRKVCSPKQEKHEMCFATKFGADGICIRGCSYEIIHYGSYEFSLNCSDAGCMHGLGCCCKGDLCNDQCPNEATTIRYYCDTARDIC
ncbi:hypothetical protein QQG55_50370 [Brugia pahangi]